VRPQMGGDLTILIFIIIMMGGLGSTLGCLIGALLVCLMANYVGFLMPVLTPFSNLLLMVIILFWRPGGLYPVAKR